MYAYVHYEKRKASHDAKPIITEIKAKLKAKKFYPGDHVARAGKGGQGGREWKKRKHLGENLSGKNKFENLSGTKKVTQK